MKNTHRNMSAAVLAAASCSLCFGGCRCDGTDATDAGGGDAHSEQVPSPSSSALAPSGAVSSSSPAPSASSPPSAKPVSKCPPEMVYVPGPHPVCVDRWECILVDKKTGERISPYYPPSKKFAVRMYDRWQKKRWEVGSVQARNMNLPPLPAWQRKREPIVMAVSKPGEVPNGYVSGKIAKLACENAGKRLCKRQEWVRACRGEQNRQFPYGDAYQRGRCNIFRYTHPSAYLHDDVSRGHLDPRLNLVADKQGPLLRKTGATKTCVSRWGNDGLSDMVGNLDEWVDDPDGTFVGGFYSRAKRDGCSSVVKNHPIYYFDYSLGVRCCLDPR